MSANDDPLAPRPAGAPGADGADLPPPAPATESPATDPPAPDPAPDTAHDRTQGSDDVAVERVTTSEEGVTADLWAFRFEDPVMAQEALLAAMRLQRRSRLKLDDAAIVVRDERGKTRIIQTKDMSTGQGVASGSWLGMLAGLFVGGPGVVVGIALGAAAGGLFAKLRDKGINDDEMKQWGDQLDKGESALFLLVEDCHRLRALHEVSRFPATVLTSTAPDALVDEVRDRLPVDPWGP